MNIDLVSNAIAITAANPVYAPCRNGEVNLKGEWAQALAMGILSEELIWSILHELTHHDSLDSVVGATLSSLAVSHTSIRGWQYIDKRWLNPARDMVRSAAATNFLRPLMEGLSMFAELDAVSGDVPVSTWASEQAGLLFYRPEMRLAINWGQDSLFPLKANLERLRQTSSGVSRKVALLQSDINRQEGYLLGYLLIKVIWCDLVQRNPAWKDHSDLFVLFVNDYFFSDYELAYLLTGPSELTIAGDITNLGAYFYNRVLSFCQHTHLNFEAFASFYIIKNNTRPIYNNYSEKLDELLQLELTKRTLRQQKFDTPDFISTRQFMRILAAPARVTIDLEGNFRVDFLDGKPPIAGKALEISRPLGGTANTADGSVEAVIKLPKHNNDYRLVLCVFQDRALVATYNLITKIHNDPEDASIFDRMASYLSLESFAARVEDEKWLPAESEEVKILEQNLGDEGMKKTLALWVPLALAADRPEDNQSISYKKLTGSGFQSALCLNEDELIKLAEVSLMPIGTLLSVADQNWVANINKHCLQELGFTLLNILDGRLAPSRI